MGSAVALLFGDTIAVSVEPLLPRFPNDKESLGQSTQDVALRHAWDESAHQGAERYHQLTH